jgi:hypothetical protein
MDAPFIDYTEAEFELIFEPLPNPEGSDLWEHAETLTHVPTFVWSVIEIDGDLFAIPGYHVVNVIGYSVTTVPWPHENVEVRFDPAGVPA